jgi:hypothetical protein
MTASPVITCGHAADLPAAWDDAAGEGFLHRSVLALLERVNPCGQRYLLAAGTPGERPSIAVTYAHRLNLLTFGHPRLRWRLQVRMVGVPCSVAAPGLSLGEADTASRLLQYLRAQPGLILALNTSEPRLDDDFASGPTLPACRLRVAWPDFDAYVASMRSAYRHRVRLALARGARLAADTLDDPARFTDDLHALYLSVFRRSAYPLECLPAEFFRAFPADITVFRAGERPAGFVQTLRQGDRLVFLFGGIDDELRGAHDTYWNMLLHVVRRGIDTGCREIDLGQTAETVKLRLGCRRVPLYLHASHPSPAARWVLRRFAGRLSYAAPQEEPRVFRG